MTPAAPVIVFRLLLYLPTSGNLCPRLSKVTMASTKLSLFFYQLLLWIRPAQKELMGSLTIDIVKYRHIARAWFPQFSWQSADLCWSSPKQVLSVRITNRQNQNNKAITERSRQNSSKIFRKMNSLYAWSSIACSEMALLNTRSPRRVQIILTREANHNQHKEYGYDQIVDQFPYPSRMIENLSR